MSTNLIKPAVPYSRHFGDWLGLRLVNSPLIYPRKKQGSSSNVDETANLSTPARLRPLNGELRASRYRMLPESEKKTLNIPSVSLFMKRAFLATFGVDGYDLTTSKIAYADTDEDNEAKAYHGNFPQTGLLIASFFGLPTRPSATDVDEVVDQKNTVSASPKTGTIIPLADSPFNIVVTDEYRSRESDHSADTSSTKSITPVLTGWQLFWNFIGGWTSLRDENGTWKPKTPKMWLNIFTLPIKLCIIFPLKLVAVVFKFLLNTLKLVTEFLPLILTYLSFTLAHWLALNTEALEKRSDWRKVLAFPLAILSLAAFALHIATRVLFLVGRAFSSPEKSARMAFAYGRELKAGKFFPIVLGVLGAFISISITAALWAITLPLAIGAVAHYFPVVLNAVTWMVQLPVVTTTLSALHGALGTAVSFLGTVFSPLLTPLSGLMGLQISAAVVTLGVTVAVLAAPLLAILSKVGDKLSDMWALWHVGKNPVGSVKTDTVELEAMPSHQKAVQDEVKRFTAGKKRSDLAVVGAEQFFVRAEHGDDSSPDQKQNKKDEVTEPNEYRFRQPSRIDLPGEADL